MKGVVGGAALSAFAAAGAAGINLTTSPTGEGGGLIEYYGVNVVGGPAPRPMPQIPIEIDDEGNVLGVWPPVREVTRQGETVAVAQMRLGDITYSSEWFQYCGVETFPGLEPTADRDNHFRYAESSQYDWQNQEVSPGDPVNVDDFADYRTWGNEIGQPGVGKPASVTWRSEGADAASTIPVLLIRSDRIGQAARDDAWLRASTREGFVAILNKCTHFCCVPGYKIDPASARFDAENEIYCPCHQSVYNPFTIIRQSFVAFPRPEEDGE